MLKISNVRAVAYDTNVIFTLNGKSRHATNFAFASERRTGGDGDEN